MSTLSGEIDYQAILKRAYDAIEDLQGRLESATRAQREPIAIVGMGLRFPGGAIDAASFWKLLHDGVDAVTEVPPDRWDVDRFYDPDPDAVGKSYSRWGGFLGGIDRFDPQFFGISPREAANMDPQQRLLLEVSWEALENAGHASADLAGSRTGIFVGMVGSDYSLLPGARIHEMDAYFGTGISRSIAAGRISYSLGLEGPSVAVDTACSSSALATHLACLSLRSGECDLALAGGVNLMLVPVATISASRARMLSPTGRCQAFDASADGYVRADGCAMIALKRLSDAVADGDHVLAVVLGSAANQDGRSNGITAPNGQAQERLIRAALADAGVSPDQVGYIEAHGTGTSLGDPIEMRAIGAVFAEARSRDEPLLVGSVKTNIGHTEALAGTAGLIKLVLALQHRTIPPHLHLREPNPHIPWDSLPVRVPTVPTPWHVPQGARRIGGVSSFGFSGTNSHILLAEPPVRSPEPSPPERPYRLLAISARNAPALEELADRYARFLTDAPDARWSDVTFTASTGRTHHAERLAVVASSVEQARERLAAWKAGESPDGVRRAAAGDAAAPEVAFLFTGQGAQYVGMGRQLYESEPVFRAAMERCGDLLRPYLERPLLSVLYPGPEGAEEAERLVHQTAYTQPALFAVEYALAQLWRSWGIEPTLVTGHSVGEYVAACVAGVFRLEDGLRLIAARGRLMQALPAGGSMAAVFADERRVAAAIAPHAGRVSIAAINGPENVVISGEGTAVRSILSRLQEEGIGSKPITVSHAFHSPLMEPMLDAFAEAAASVEFSAPRIGLVSNLSGRLAGEEIARAAYWREHVRAPVRFADALATLRAEGCTAFLEIGPSPTLLGLARRGLAGDGETLHLPSLRPGRGDSRQMLDSLAALYTAGAAVDWRGMERREGQRRIPLPTYPFQRQRYWMNFSGPARTVETPRLHPLLHERLRSPLISSSAFQSRLAVDAPAYLNDHRIFDAPLFPATGFLEMAWAAAREVFGAPESLESVQFRDALALPETGEATVQVTISAPEEGRAAFQVFSLHDPEADSWKLHAAGQVKTGSAAPAAAAGPSLEALRARCTGEFPVRDFYDRLAELGVGYGPAFRGLRQVWRGEGEALARIELPEEVRREAGDHQLHPALLDACIQLLGAAIPGADDIDAAADVYLPVEIGSYRLLRSGRPALWCHAALDRLDATGDVLAGELRLLDDGGAPIAEIGGVHMKRVTREAIARVLGGAMAARRLDEWLYSLDWERVDPPERSDGRLAGRWLILADGTGVAEALGRRLEAEGGTCVLAREGDLDPLEPASFVRLMEAAETGHGSLRGAVHLWSLDAPTEPTPGEIHEHQRRVCGSTLSLVKALVSAGAPGAGLWLVTRGAQAVPGDAHAVFPAQAPLWGLANTITAEHPELGCVCLDLEATPDLDAAAAIAAEFQADDREDRIAWRARGRHVARIVRHPDGGRDAAPPAGEAVELEIADRGILDNLVLRPAARRRPGPGEVEIEVRASGLNFRDVLNALDMYPGDAGPLGSECAGTVVAVGEGVGEFRIGDEVVALAGGTFRSHLTAPIHSVHPKPAGLSLPEAAAVPITFLTAYYGLHSLAGIRAGDRVLVHAAAGGVGLAAVQLALLAGAEVFGTAGSPEKREYLRSIGVEHVMSSRTLDFARETMALTGGAGVNIVLNSLADDFIPQSLSVLAEGGCFLEIGKRGVWTPEQVAERAPTVRYHLYDLSEALGPGSEFFRTTLDWLFARFDSGALRPLPMRTFPLARAADAFRFMAQAKHTGKIVITPERRLAAAGPVVRGDGTYLITGGLGGLGLAVARGLVERGARSMALMGRSAPSDTARETIEELEKAGARVLVFAGDVGSEHDVRRLLDEVEATMPPLRGVVHAAGVIDDGMLLQQSWTRFETVMRPKVLGTWHLHTHTRGLPLDFFVLFSTGSAVLGSAGQGNYSAANAFLDAVAHHRRALGLPATSINWGAWSDVGMAAALGSRGRERWRQNGLGMIAPTEGVQVLERILREDPPQVAVLPIDWSRFLRSAGASGPQPILARMAAAGGKHEPDAAPPAAADLLRELEAAEPRERPELLRAHVHGRVVRVLALDPATRLGPHQGFSDLGMDSLMAVELSNHLQASLGIKLPSTLAFEYPTLEALTDHLAAHVLSPVPGEEESSEAQPWARNDDAGEPEGIRTRGVVELSESEAESALLLELKRAGY